MALVLFPALAGATARSQAHARASSTKLERLPRLWAVQVTPGRRGWFDRTLLKRVSEDGINALTLRISSLGRKQAAKRTFDSVRRFAAGEKLYLIAVLPAGKPRTPAARHAVAVCSSRRFARLRCAVRARSAAADAKLARKRNSAGRPVVVYVKGPRRISGLAGVRGSARRPTIVIAPLEKSFDASVWGTAVGQAAANASVDMGVAPKSSAALQQFAAMLAGKTGSAAGSSGGDTTSPSTPTGLAASSVTQSSVTLSWGASTDNIGVAGYRLFVNGTQVGTSSAASFSFTGLSCGTSYTLGVAAYDAAGNQSVTATTSQSTSVCSDTQPPSTPTGLAIGGIGSASVTLSWDAAADNVGVAAYRLFVNGIQVGSSLTTSYLFSGLSCQTVYTLGVAAADAAGNVSSVATTIAQTAACSETEPPSTPAGLTTSGVGQTSVTLSWNASTDNVGVAGYRLFLNGSQVAGSTSTSYSFTGLACGTSYTLGVAAYDGAGNMSATATTQKSTSACPDTQAPSTPSSLAAGSVTQTSLKLSWKASSDNVGVTGYRLFLNGSQVGTSTSTSYSFGGLTCGTSYTLGVAAYDAAGNGSGTATLAQSTSPCPDTQPPSTPAGLATGGIGQTSVTLSWSASTDNVGVTGYRLFVNEGSAGTSASTSYSFSGLTCGTSYTLGVAAYDAAGNVSATATTTATTAACPSGGAGTANIFVSAAGSDSSCSRSSSPTDYADASGHICATPGKACKLAQSGDTVILEDGTYSGDFSSCEGHQNYAQNVVFEPEPGRECPMSYPAIPTPWSDTSCDVNLDPGGYAGDGVNLAGGSSKTCGVSGNPLPDTLTPAQRSTWINHLTLQGMYIGAFYAVCSAYIELDNDAGSAYYIGQGAYHFYIHGGDYGNETDAEQPTIGDSTCGCSNWPPAEDVRVVGTVEHDFITQGSGHGDGIFVDPSYDVQIVKNVFARDDCIPLYVNYATSQGQPIGVHGLMVIGNVVHTDTIHNGGAHCGQAISLGNNDQTDTIVAFNSLEGPVRRSNSSELNQNIRIVGNVAGQIDAASSGNQAGCGSGTTAAYNVLVETGANKCGDLSNVLLQGVFPLVSEDTQPNSPSGTNQYFTAPLGNYTIASGSAGAPAVGRLPISWCNTDSATQEVCAELPTDIDGNPRPNPAHPSYYDAGAYENR